VGFVFQTFNLLPRANALKQVMLPMSYQRNGAAHNDAERRALATAALEQVGLGDRTKHRPAELSGGQRQRVAIARALVTEPSLLLADEPTGNLDSHAGAEVLELLEGLHRERGITIVMVTHESEVATHAMRVIHMRDGQIVEEVRN
jgi:ABC-type lipoprotein export system ATPase subunit